MTERELKKLARRVREATERRNAAILEAASEGKLSQRQIARAVGLSHTRVQQLVNAAKRGRSS